MVLTTTNEIKTQQRGCKAAKTQNKNEMTKEEEKKYITWAGNLTVLYADYCSGKVFDFVQEARSAGLRFECKKAVSVLEKLRKALEGTISKCLQERNLFASIVQRLEDYTQREYNMLEYALGNALGRTTMEHHDLTKKALAVYILLLNVDASNMAIMLKLRKLKYHKPKRLTADIKPLLTQIINVINILTKKNSQFVDLDADEVVSRASKVLSLRLTDREQLERIFTESELENL